MNRGKYQLIFLKGCWSFALSLLSNPFTSRLLRAVSVVVSPFLPPYITVREHRMRVKELDRFFVALMWKFSVAEDYETELFKSLIQPGMTVVDIGANIGYYTLLFARWVGPSGRVLAFEPETVNSGVLAQNIEINRYANVTLFPVALSDREGAATFYISDVNQGDHRLNSSGGNHRSVQVETTTLDSVLAANPTRIDAIKMDIQGAEYAALQGMRRTLESNPSVKLIFEFVPDLIAASGHAPVDVLNFLRELGFQTLVIDEKNRKLLKMEPNEIIKTCASGKIFSLYAAR